MNVKGTRVSAHVQLGLTSGDERQILSGLRYLKHTWSKQILFKSALCWQRIFTRLESTKLAAWTSLRALHYQYLVYTILAACKAVNPAI